MKAVFNDIYAQNIWGYGSGEGSLPRHTRGYIRFIERFIRERQIKSVVDYGCGDWQFSRLINWDGVEYLGLDLVDSIIDLDREAYQKDHIKFAVLDETRSALPDADLFIAKDVFQHWSNQSILSFMPRLARYRYVLITNCVNPYGSTVNRDISDGDFRQLDLRLPPFSYEMEKVYEFTNNRGPLGVFIKPRWKKAVLSKQNDTT